MNSPHNQNPVDSRDQRSTDSVQRGLQAEVKSLYGSELFIGVRQGEKVTAPKSLDNGVAAQYLTAVYLSEPWAAVRKVRLFEDDYRKIFSREVDAHRLYFLHLLIEVVETQRGSLANELSDSFASAKFTLAFLVAEMLRMSVSGTELLNHPERWLPSQKDEVVAAVAVLAQEAVTSMNYYVTTESADRAAAGVDLDPKVAFKSANEVRKLRQSVVRFEERQAQRGTTILFDIPPGS